MSPELLQEPQGWAIVRQYESSASARRAWETTRDLLLSDDLEASTFRFTLAGVSFVAVVGELPLEPAGAELLEGALAQGAPAPPLPDAVIEGLQRRRRHFKRTGWGFYERRNQ